MRAAGILAVVVLLQLACGDQQATSPTPVPTPTPVPQPVPPPVPATVVVTGHLRDARTNEPIIGASVVLRRPDGLNVGALSDGAGHYGFANVPAGEVTIRAAKDTHDGAERQVTLTVDTTVDMVLAPRKYALFGRVTDVTSGLPLASATVTVADGLNAARSTTSGSDGTYRLPDLWFGGFTLRVRRTAYDSVFRAVNFARETELDIQMRVAQQSLAGTWAGEMTSTGFFARVPVAIPEVTMMHTGATVAGSFPARQGNPAGEFTDTLPAASAIGTTTQVIGTLTIRRGPPSGPRLPPPPPCIGTGQFTGLVNWTHFVITAPQVTFSCGGTESVTLSLLRQQ